MVVTTAPPVTRRSLCAAVSATTTVRVDASAATPSGLEKAAAAPTPSAEAHVPDPASVITAPAALTLRRRQLPLSATNAKLAASTAMA